MGTGEETMMTFSELYRTVIDRVLGNDAESTLRRFLVIRSLEREVGEPFTNTRTFNYLCKQYLANLKTGATTLRENNADSN